MAVLGFYKQFGNTRTKENCLMPSYQAREITVLTWKEADSCHDW